MSQVKENLCTFLSRGPFPKLPSDLLSHHTFSVCNLRSRMFARKQEVEPLWSSSILSPWATLCYRCSWMGVGSSWPIFFLGGRKSGNTPPQILFFANLCCNCTVTFVSAWVDSQSCIYDINSIMLLLMLSRPAVTKYHKLGYLTEIYPPEVWRLEIWAQRASKVGPSERHTENLFLAFFPGSVGLQELFGPWCSTPHPGICCHLSRTFSPCVLTESSICACLLPNFPLLKRH